jgi:hypothetical protein
MTRFRIDKGLPAPSGRSGRPPKYPFRELEVGDSFFVEGDPRKLSGSVLGCAKNIVGKRFSSQKTTHNGKPGIRVWRVA